MARKAVRRLASGCRRSEEWLLLEKALSEDVSFEVPSGMVLSDLTMDDLRTHRFFKAIHFPEDLENRFRAGDLCVGVYIDGELAHVAWMGRDQLHLDIGVPTFPAPGSAGLYDAFTLPRFRRRGCQTAGIRSRTQRAREEGLTRALSVVRPNNLASRGALEKCGFTVRGRLSYRRVLWRQRLDLEEREAPSSPSDSPSLPS